MVKKRFFQSIPILLLVGCFVGVLVIVNAVFHLGSICLLKSFVGIPCPSCGMTRSYMALLKGDFSLAFYFHPLWVMPMVLYLIYLFQDGKWLNGFVKRRSFWGVLLLFYLGVYALRMFFLFPDEMPMNVNTNAMFWQLFKSL